MSIYAVLPVKSLGEVKSRLAPTLTLPGRSSLALQLLQHSADAVLESGVIDACAVVSPDPAVLAEAENLGAVPLMQHEGALIEGIELGRAWAREAGASHLLVLLPDLPLLTAAEVADMADQVDRNLIVIAPDQHETGTNALLISTADEFRFGFGVGSLQKHLREARRLHLSVYLYNSTGTQFDIDTPRDLLRWRSMREEARIA